MKLRIIISVLFLFIASVYAEEAAYRTYRNESFPNLQFSVLSKWKVERNGKEIVFYIPGDRSPQLFLQTVGKWKGVDTLEGFYQFEIKKDDHKPIEKKLIKIAGYDAIEYTSLENYKGDSIKQITLIVDVGEGFIWFYLKSDAQQFEKNKEIFDKIKDTFKF